MTSGASIVAPTSVTASSAPTAVPAVTPTLGAVGASAAASGTFESTVYPYSITLPAGVATRNWHAATRMWNGEIARSVGPYDDQNGSVDGALFIFGTAWTKDLAAFTSFVSRMCGAPTSVRSIELAGEFAGVGATVIQQVCTGVPVVRVLLVRGGLGLVINLEPNPGFEKTGPDDLLAWLGGLGWRGS